MKFKLLLLAFVFAITVLPTFTEVMSTVDRVPEVETAFLEGSYIDLVNLNAEYGKKLIHINNSLQFEYIRYKYFSY